MHRNCERAPARKRGIRLGKLDKLAILRCSIGTFETALSANRDGVCFHQMSREGVIDFELRQLSFDCERISASRCSRLFSSACVIFSFSGTPVISLFFTRIFRGNSKCRTSAQLPVHYQKPADDATRSVHGISEKFALFPLRVPQRCGRRIFKSPTERIRAGINITESAGSAYPLVYARRVEFHFGDSVFCRE